MEYSTIVYNVTMLYIIIPCAWSVQSSKPKPQT